MRGLLLVAILWIAPVPSSADPEFAATWLRTEPVTMMDMGLFRVNALLQSGDKPLQGNAIFLTNPSSITIFRMLVPGLPEVVEKTCLDWVGAVRALAGVPSDADADKGMRSYFASMFSHVGYEPNSVSKEAWRSVDELFHLRCFARVDVGGGKAEILTISATLLGTGYSIERE